MPQLAEAPFVADSEALVLGAIISDAETVIPAIEERVGEADFARPLHRRVFRIAMQIHEDGGRPDIVSIGAALTELGESDAGQQLAYLSQLADAGIYAAIRIEYHVEKLRESTRRRRLAEAGRKIQALADPEIEVEEAIDEAGRLVLDVATDAALVESLRKIEGPEIRQVIEEKASKKTGVPTGFRDVDRMTFGFAPGDLVVIAGATGMGKTSYALQTAVSAARSGYPVAIFSLEMTRDELIWRMLCAEGMIDASKYRRDGPGGYPDSTWRIERVSMELKDLPIYVDDTSAVPLSHVRSRCRRMKAKHGLGLVVIDHLQIMRAEGETRAQALAEVTGGCKALAKDLGVPVVLLSQLSRFKDRADKRPTLSDLRESGAIEQDANTVLLLHRPEYYFGPTSKQGDNLVGKAECIIAKQRNGATGIVDLFFRAECARFEDLEDRE
ncbi:MAG TPA: replicative DNA helicase [Longimicrobiaceae bacterium]